MLDPDDPRCFYPAAERNQAPILDALRELLPAAGHVLEVASGSGQHVAHFAAALPELSWQPSDRDPELLPSIAAWTRGLPNVRPPIVLDVEREAWPSEVFDDAGSAPRIDVIYNANMIHIAPWSAALALLSGAGRALAGGRLLVLYGPYKLAGTHTAPSNADFDRSLRARDARWGVRDLEDVQAAAARHGLSLERRFAMPANNQLVAFRAG